MCIRDSGKTYILGGRNTYNYFLGDFPGHKNYDRDVLVVCDEPEKENSKVGEADGVLGTSTDEHGKNVYTLSWEHRGITPVSYTHLDVYKRQTLFMTAS